MHQKVVGVKILVLACVCIIQKVSSGTTKYFKYDTNILNPENWDTNVQNCSGLWFAEENDASVYLDSLTVNQIVFPKRGPITLIIGNNIVLKKTTKKCTKLKPMLYHDWDDFRNWRSDVTNPAVPHLERLPCYDDILVLPKPNFMRISTTRTSINFHTQGSFSYDSMIHTWPVENLLNPLTARPVQAILSPVTSCTTNNCKCHRDYDPQCPNLSEAPPLPKLKCLQPVQPENFCSGICGASLTFKPLTNFKLHEIVSELGEYSSETHASSLGEKIQVVFAEKEFEGQSLRDARDFYAKLGKKKSYASALKLVESGEYFNGDVRSGNGFSLIFGTFVGVVLVFGLIFYLHDKNLEQFGLFSVLYRFGSSARTGFRDGFFARFDNTDENLIIENQSIAGSVLHLEKSFDNPMYQEGGTSSSDDRNQHENPLFNVALNEE